MTGNRLCELVGIEYPIFQGGMAWVANASLASAVSNAGGLGIIAAMNANAATSFAQEIRKMPRQMTDKPFGVNVMLMSPFADEVAAGRRRGRASPVVTTGAGNSRQIHEGLAGGRHQGRSRSCPRWHMAKLRGARSGASAVIAEGGESGGHVGDLTTMALVPAGGATRWKSPSWRPAASRDGRGVAAAFMLGACGVQVGTRFLVRQGVHRPPELQGQGARRARHRHDGHRQAAAATPCAALKNHFTSAFAGLEYESSRHHRRGDSSSSAPARCARPPVRATDKRAAFMCRADCRAWSTSEQPAAEIIREMFTQAEDVLRESDRYG